ncbi:hypothetical protein BJF79_44915 [Actinomadura sp. CNU-125]|uniref:hypothetical protein n=1 Tax=Actinomadura sp. CNU-125 TaxID=1904961 RepID=UPI00096010D6|nr:hypothetical protein [Actinomadura sp. CNU-125]OLT24690.1 hypothetical protein BJF79_44915 [Actinomadura sp. CNU-125]
MTTTTTTTAARSVTGGPRPLRLALRLDAAVTAVNGLAYLALAGPVDDLLGLDPGPGRALGAFLLVYAAAVWAVSAPARPHRLAVTAVVEANLLWTVLSVAAVAFGWFSLGTAGAVWAVLQAAVVAGFAAVQYTALRRTR